MGLEDVLKLKTPDELWAWMHNNIVYGWTNKNGDFREYNDNRMLDEYYFHSPKETVERKSGICGDQVLLEKAWFDYHNIENHTISFGFLDNDGTRIGGGHIFLYYIYNGKYYYFENAFMPAANIIEYDNLNELIGRMISAYLVAENMVDRKDKIYVIKDSEIKEDNTVQDNFVLEKDKEDIYLSVKHEVDKGIKLFA